MAFCEISLLRWLLGQKRTCPVMGQRGAKNQIIDGKTQDALPRGVDSWSIEKKVQIKRSDT